MSQTDDSGQESRLAFAGIDEETCAQLRKLWPLIEPNLDGILAGFYDHLRKDPRMKALVGDRQGSLESAQKKHWKRLFTSGFDADYVASINRIGRAHVRIGLEPRWYIAGYQHVMSALTRLVIARFRFSPTRAGRAVDAITKATMLDLDYAISTYQTMLIEREAERNARMNEAFERFRATVDRTLGAVAQTADTMQDRAGVLSDVAGSASSEAVSASAASEQTSVGVQTVASAAEELSSSIEEIGRQITGASDVARRAATTTDSASDEVGRLSSAAQKIGDVIGLIQAIAEQTNLLALNATIEAARAGEAGRGFAIVAQEVKELASQTSKATEDIAAQITEVQTGTTKAVDAIRTISTTVGEIDSLTAALAAAVEEQGAATREISANVQQAATGTQTLSRSVSSVSGAIDKTGAAAEDFLKVSESLRTQSTGLADEIRDFFREIETISVRQDEGSGSRSAA